MSPQEFLESVVLPNMDEFSKGDDLRRAFNAIAAVDALAAHISQNVSPQEKDDSRFRQNLADKNEDFKLVRDMAKAQKHVRLDRGNPVLKEADRIKLRSLGWGEGEWGAGLWGGSPQVVVEMDSGETQIVGAVLERALAFLKTIIPPTPATHDRTDGDGRDEGAPP